jgi:hypothetical protein
MTFSLEVQIAEVEEEVRKRRKLYTRLVDKGDMRPAVADYKIAAMLAVRDTLTELLKQRT